MPKTWVFQSDSNPNATFTTTLRDDGTRTCTCHGCKPLASGGVSCKHTRLIDQGLADQQAVSTKGKAIDALEQFAGFIKAAGDVSGFEFSDFDIPKLVLTTDVPIPQLLTPIKIEDAPKYLNDDKWAAQEKMDGKRIIIKVYQTNGGDWEVAAYNRKGKTCDIPDGVIGGARKLGHECVIDGELIGDIFHAFDLLEWDGKNIRNKPYEYRYSMLGVRVHLNACPLRLVPLATSTKKKTELFNLLTKKKREGVVFKKLAAKYTAGRGPDQIKCKFYATVTCLVTSHSTQISKHTGSAKSSISLGLSKDKKEKNVKWVGVGNCTVPSGWKLPPVGSLVEIRYLYAYKGGSLYQPVFLGVRDDVEADCLEDLKYKSEEGGSLDVGTVTKKPVAPAAGGLRRRVLWK